MRAVFWNGEKEREEKNDRVSLMPKRCVGPVGPLFARRTCWPRNNKRRRCLRGIIVAAGSPSCYISSSRWWCWSFRSKSLNGNGHRTGQSGTRVPARTQFNLLTLVPPISNTFLLTIKTSGVIKTIKLLLRVLHDDEFVVDSSRGNWPINISRASCQ